MLVGRQAELAELGRALTAARDGRSSSLALAGEAGIGKSSLLGEAERLAHGMTVLRATGFEAETELPYAALSSIARPLLELGRGLPSAQARALRAALAIDDGVQADPLAVCAAMLGLLSLAAERRPVALLVDDAHWLDRETSQVVGFVARRLADEAVALFVALRPERGTFDPEGIRVLELGGLDAAEAASLLCERVAPAVAERLAHETHGNPLALLEVVDLLSDEQRAGLEPVSAPLPVGAGLERAFGRRLELLGPETRLALVVAAAAGVRDELEVLVPAWEHLGLPSSLPVLPAERAGLVTVADGRLRFRHPLVRAAAYGTASPPDRRAAHEALAGTLEGADRDEAAWHRALAATGPDEAVAAELEDAGRRTASRSLHAAASALERAASLTPPGEARSRRLLAAASAAVNAGSWAAAARSLDALDEAEPNERDGVRLLLRGLVQAHGRVDPRGAVLLESAAAELGSSDPERAATALVHAATAWSTRSEFERARSAAEAAAALPLPPGGATEQAVAMSLGDTAGWLGRLDEADREWRRAATLVDEDDPQRLQIAGEAVFSAGDDQAAQTVLRRAERLARERGALGTLTTTLQVLALSQVRSGALAAAYADALETFRLVQALGRHGDTPGALVNLAWLEAMLGHEDACRGHAAEAYRLRADPDASPARSFPVGLLELSLGRADLAATAFDGILVPGSSRLDGDPVSPRPIVPSLVEALVRLGRVDEAATWLGARLDVARSSGRPDAAAPFERANALVHADEESYREALGWHERWSNRFERARTELCYGELLRRLKRRSEARIQLRAAVDGFDAVGARLWSERARSELAATGERARRRRPDTVDELTPQELKVARLVATGLTNREAAQRLFLSPKTIETHLAHVFRKTGVRTRAELAHRFRDLPDSIAARLS